MRLGISPEADGVVLSFGNIREYKGIDVLLRAFARVVESQPRVMLVIAGKPWVNWQPYDQLIDKLGLRRNVQLHLDFVPADDVELYFEASDVVVLPYTHFDGQSGVASLALPFGKPLIVTDVGGLPDLVSSAECVVRPGDAGALARVLLCVLGDDALRDRLGEASLRRARDLDWGAIAERTTELYARLGTG